MNLNALDVLIIGGLVAFFVMHSNRSFIYYGVCSSGLFAGYLLGAAAAPLATKNFSSDLTKGILSLGLMVGLAIVLGLVGVFIGRKLKMKMLLSRFFTLDKALAMPYKIVAALLAIFLLSQTLIYIPILGLQFEAQGSTLLMIAHTALPASSFGHLTQQIAPEQFRNLHLAYDPTPLTYNNITNAGEFQKVVDAVAPSVVKISGKNCVGLGFGSGFVVAPGLVVTNAHVISGASSVYISDHQGAYPATPVVIDNNYDIAVLYSRFIQGQSLPLATTQAVPGTKGISLGYPEGGDLRMVQGLVSARAYKSSHNELNGSNTITLTASLGGGSSGGPTFNLKGEVIGVNDAGGNGDLVAIKADAISRLVDTAKKKLYPASTDFCAVPPKFY